MKTKISFNRWTLIIQKLKKRPSSFDEIYDFLEEESDIQGYDFTVSLRTFQRDLKDIESVFGIEIKYDRSQGVYRIVEDSNTEIKERMLEAFDTFNALQISERMSDYIHFENRKSKGVENLYGFLHAIKNKLLVSFSYHKFWEESPEQRTIESYALKEFANRWYILGYDINRKAIRSFALDRLSEFEIHQKKFSPTINFNVEEYYKHSFGIISPENGQKPEEIIISCDTFQGKYIKALPFHHSQEIIKDTDDQLIIKLFLIPTYDFIQELLSKGKTIKVLQPQSLIQEIKQLYQAALSQYED
jgi:predicted DNA-binding transcriptional regulator YafY